MITPELLDFVRLQISRGTTRERVSELLLAQGGWARSDIEEAFQELDKRSIVPQSFDLSQKPAENTDEDFLGIFTSEGEANAAPDEKIVSTTTEPVKTEPIQEVQELKKTDTMVHIFEPSTLSKPQSEELPGITRFAPSSVEKTNIAIETPASVDASKIPPVVSTPTYGNVGGKVFTPSSDATVISRLASVAPVSLQPQERKPDHAEIASTSQAIETKTQPPMTPVSIHAPEVRTFTPSTGEQDGTAVQMSASDKEHIFSPILPHQPQPSEKVTQQQPPEFVSQPMSKEQSSIGLKNYQDLLKQANIGSSDVAAPATNIELPVAEKVEEKKVEGHSSMESWLEGLKGRKADEKSAVETVQSQEETSAKGGEVTAVSATETSAARLKKKHIINLIFIILIAIILVTGAVYALLRFIGPNASNVLVSSYDDFVGLTSFQYKSNTQANIELDKTEQGGEKGRMQLSLVMDGALKNSANGFGDGTHKFQFDGMLESSAVRWSTSLKGDLRIVGSTLYINATTPPQNAAIDPDLLKNYWIKIDLGQIAAELALQGIGRSDTYGQFGDPKDAHNVIGLLSKNFPFLPGTNSVMDTVDGVEVYRYPLVVDGPKSLLFVRELYKTLTGKEIDVSSDESIRWNDAMKKAVVNVWVGKNDNKIRRFSFELKPDDQIFGVRTRGAISMDVTLSNFNLPAETEVPDPIITLDELRGRMEEYKSLLAVRMNDAAKVALVGDISSALKKYADEKGRYPVLLQELTQGKYLQLEGTSTDLVQFNYYAYTSSSSPMKSNRCTQKSKLCLSYHIGVNLDDATDPLLANDSDVTGEIQGSDEKGCKVEANKFCYDLFTTYTQEDIQASSTPVAATTTSQ